MAGRDAGRRRLCGRCRRRGRRRRRRRRRRLAVAGRRARMARRKLRLRLGPRLRLRDGQQPGVRVGRRAVTLPGSSDRRRRRWRRLRRRWRRRWSDGRSRGWRRGDRLRVRLVLRLPRGAGRGVVRRSGRPQSLTLRREDDGLHRRGRERRLRMDDGPRCTRRGQDECPDMSPIHRRGSRQQPLGGRLQDQQRDDDRCDDGRQSRYQWPDPSDCAFHSFACRWQTTLPQRRLPLHRPNEAAA